MSRPSHEDFLRGLAADRRGHSGSDLLAHLKGVEAFLAAWDAREAVCTAGLYHSVYGTESYSHTTLDPALRDDLRAQIGDEAELLVFYFGAMEKNSFYANLFGEPPFTIRCRLTAAMYTLTEEQFRDLCELTVANWLEQRPRVGEAHQYIRSNEFRAMRPWLSAPARVALDDAYGFHAEA